MIVTEKTLFSFYAERFPEKNDYQLELMVQDTHEQYGYPQMYESNLIVLGGIENELLSARL